MNIKALVSEAKLRINNMTPEEIRHTFIKHGYKPNETKKSYNSSYDKDESKNTDSSKI
jgi:hypothetical protein